MTGAETAQIIQASATLLTAFGVILNITLTSRNGRKIEEVHKATNGMSERLEKQSGLAGEARGVEKERIEERSRQDAE